MAAADESVIELGFAEGVDSFKLQPVFFPSKIGGKPAWLSQENIPPVDQIKCYQCGNIMNFLLQIYAPRDGHVETFHRMIYVFMCRNGSCFDKNSNTPFKTFRNQLPRENKFFSYEPISAEGRTDDVMQIVEQLQTKWGSLCSVCGCKADKKCSACNGVSYCSKDHQLIDWRRGHKFNCSGAKMNSVKNQGKNIRHQENFLLPEFEIVTEPEENTDETESDHSCVTNFEIQSDGLDTELDTEGTFAEVADKQFQKFKEIINRDPEQVLRYHYGGSPLWVSTEHQANPEDIPYCSCGAKRLYEFQILPQLLNYLNLDSINGKSIDFGTLAVYTCADNCPASTKYSAEFIWKQDFSDVNVKFQ